MFNKVENNITPIQFITKIKKKYTSELEEIFMWGYCYWFAHILKNRFDGEIYYLPISNHFITKIDNQFYDIRGIVEPREKAYSWEEYKLLEPIGTKRIERDCILKNT